MAKILVVEDELGAGQLSDFGFKFLSPVDGVHYGWLHAYVFCYWDKPGDLVSQAAIPEWAFESEPNTPITVGAVPGPTTAVLLLIGVAALIRRRRPAWPNVSAHSSLSGFAGGLPAPCAAA